MQKNIIKYLVFKIRINTKYQFFIILITYRFAFTPTHLYQPRKYKKNIWIKHYQIIIFVHKLWFNFFELSLLKSPQERPSQVKRFLNTSIFINPLVNKFIFKICEETD